MKDVGTKTIKTKRLVLRRFVIEDAEAMFREWATDKEVTKYLTWFEHKDIEESRIIMNQWVKLYDEPHTYRWAITEIDKNIVIGSIDVVRFEETEQHGDIGYCIGSDYWGKGYVTEALKAVIKYLFEEVDMNRISARHEVANPASGKVMQKAGMLFEGVMREAHLTKNGRFTDMALYAILKKDYYKSQI